ncbi:MAG: hypothetical protein JWQ38_164 [Flavipsychrobacter sp.]|nr:hypothetical protein [Flavipsychrobacter sp.]
MKSTLSLFLLSLIISFCSFAAPDWVMVQNNDGRFKAMFPAAPVTDIDTSYADGQKIPWKSFMYNSMQATNENSIYGILYADYPPSQANSDVKDKRNDDFLEHALAKSVTGINGHVIKQEAITYKAFPGKEVKVSFAHGKAVMDLKIYLIHSRCYILQVGYMTKNEGNSAIDKFFNSFELLGEK